MPPRKHLAERLRSAREAVGLTQQQVADWLGVHACVGVNASRLASRVARAISRSASCVTVLHQHTPGAAIDHAGD